ncbi:(Fe-S)-binding protein [Stygiolobus caldivivus]|uniref:4Fe-4S ferredoxin-type domain-containing protein n=1 Tax=Stygiolobus caldivivus TaxID=2824673 RepID=A0A8D5U5M6_9CREN|nr:(Fe-S)-binding protein [Stygiolobus caldivivus]BCU69442.1 hypothetical protein KN1_07390 [Stygiolobus caldivivus]
MGLNEELSKCVHCGFCLEACPTYVITRSETHSPRGRIAAVKLGINSEGLATCMFCRRCELACPSGVKYSDIITAIRKPNLLEKIILKMLENPKSLVSFVKPVLRLEGFSPLEYEDEDYDIVLFPGCITSVVFRKTVENALRYLKSQGYRVKIFNGCCGLAHAHVGEMERAKQLVGKLKEVQNKPIISLSSNCSAFMKENGLDVYDFSEFIVKLNKDLPKKDIEVTVHEPCHAHLLGLDKYTREVLLRMGVNIKESEEPSFECGAGGDYFLFHRELSEQVMSVKREKTLKSGVSTVVSTNPSCSIAFLKMGLTPVHVADLIFK